MSHDPIVQFLSRLHHPMLASIDLKLDRMLRLLSMLGSPHKRLPPVIHVAGTNGKGSLLAYLQSILTHAGYRVHKYTSPHLVYFRERIVLNGKEIDEQYLANVVKHVAGALANQPATFFEAATAAAFLAFSEHPADVLLLETGMGGRLDATNIIDKPLLTAITPIAMDHMEYLGTTLPAIAGEKAGIIKRGVPCVVGRQEPEAFKVLEEKAASLSASVYRFGHEWNVKKFNTHGEYHSATRNIAFSPALAGAFQYDNAGTAIACLDLLPQFKVTDEQIKEGLAKAIWPARIQPITSGRLADMVHVHELWLDGGHNPQGGQVLGAWLSAQTKDVYLICGMMKGKDAKSYLAPLAPNVKKFFAVAIPEESNCHNPAMLAEYAREVGMESSESAGIENALQTIAEHAKTPSLVCICGSLYLAGYVLRVNNLAAAA